MSQTTVPDVRRETTRKGDSATRERRTLPGLPHVIRDVLPI